MYPLALFIVDAKMENEVCSEQVELWPWEVSSTVMSEESLGGVGGSGHDFLNLSAFYKQEQRI